MTTQDFEPDSHVYFPPELLCASSVSFDEPIHGYLLDARPRDGGYRAAIFFDLSNQHGNGDTINTDQVVQMTEQHGYHLVKTANQQCFVIVSYMMVLMDDADRNGRFQIMSLTHTGPVYSSGGTEDVR